MHTFDYEEYLALFNTGDDKALCETFFTEDAVMQTADRTIPDRAALLDFLTKAHDGVREILHPQVVLQDAHYLLAEIDIEFHATADRPGFVFGPLRKGESLLVKFFVVYTLRGNRICYLKTARWPVGYGIES